MLDVSSSLQRSVPGIVINAEVGRQVWEGLAVVARLLASRQLGMSVVFALGTNGTFSQSAFAQLIQLTKGRRLVVVTAHCGHCSWVGGNNAMLRAGCNRRSHCTLADWYTLAQANPGWFVDWPDGVHLPIGGRGTAVYATMVRLALTA
jgi:hypothetical protein